MSGTSPPSPRSRRERPAKPALSREGIVSTALALLRDGPAEAVTLRRVAAALDTGAASLYVYIRDTEDLHAAMLEALLEGLAADGPGDGAWDGRLIELLTRYVHVLYAHPGVARRALFTQPSGPHFFALVERLLSLLREGGVGGRAAAWGVDLLLQVATATAAEHGHRRAHADAEVAWSALVLGVATADAAAHPRLAAAQAELLSGTPPERLEWTLRRVLAGVQAAAAQDSP